MQVTITVEDIELETSESERPLSIGGTDLYRWEYI